MSDMHDIQGMLCEDECGSCPTSLLNDELNKLYLRTGSSRLAFRRTLDLLVSHLGIDGAAIWLMNPDTGVLEIKSRAGALSGMRSLDRRVPPGSCPIAVVASRRRAYASNTLQADLTSCSWRWAVRHQISAIAAIPLMVEDRLLGVLALLGRKRIGRAQLAALSSAAARLAFNIDRWEAHAKLADQVIHMERAIDAARIASEQKSALMARVSHEIRTPLNGILGLTGLLLDTPLSSAQQDLARTAQQASESLVTLINDLLDFCKIEAGKLTTVSAPFDLGESVEQVADMLFPRAYEKGLELVVRFAPGTHRHMIGDSTRIRQVLANLVGNAVKFTHHGQVVVDVVTVNSGAGTAAVRIEVSDTGIGISRRDLKRIFAPFTQAHGSAARPYGGVGLGLTITKQIVETLGGSINVASERGKGSTFWVVLPLKHDNHPTRDNDVTPYQLNGVRALVIEPSDALLQVMDESLSEWGMRLTCRSSAENVLSLIQDAASVGDPYRAVIMDYDTNGSEVDRMALAIRSISEFSTTRLLAIAGGIPDHCLRTSRAGCESPAQDMFVRVPKPLRKSRLLAALNDALRTSRDAEEEIAGNSEQGHDLQGPHIRIADRPPGPRVLVAEDNAINQKVTRLLLEKLGCQVDLAPDGKDVLKATARTRYDVVFMDCCMPIMNGCEATRRIRKGAGPCRNVTIIGMSAHSLKEDIDRCIESGMNGYIIKPAREADFLRHLPGWPGMAAAAIGVPSAGVDVAGSAGHGVLGCFLEGRPCLSPELRQFVGSELGRLCSTLAGHIHTGEAEATRAVAHELKGALLSLGAHKAAEEARKLESAARSREMKGAPRVFAALEAEVGLVSAAISQIPDQPKPNLAVS